MSRMRVWMLALAGIVLPVALAFAAYLIASASGRSISPRARPARLLQ
jgi:hypothetical protein